MKNNKEETRRNNKSAERQAIIIVTQISDRPATGLPFGAVSSFAAFAASQFAICNCKFAIISIFRRASESASACRAFCR
ncbi:MAG: hypothetical protein EHM48_08480, partial [Planctomycetaceae bacterium]